MTYNSDPTPDHFDLFMAAQRELQLHLMEVTRLETYKNKQTFKQGDMNGRLLAMMGQHDHTLTLISILTAPNGETVTSLSDILKAFNSFYETLYTSALPSDFQTDALQDLLDLLALGWLLDKERETLVQPFMGLEVLNAIQSFPSEKAPGPDGLPMVLYKTHGDLLAPLLVHTGPLRCRIMI